MHSAKVINDALWLFGGKWMVDCTTEVFGDLWAIHLNAGAEDLRWNQLSTIGKGPCARYAAATTSFRDKFVLHGGNDEQDVTLEDMFILDTNKLSWYFF
jgi:hypothetical protein